MTRVGERRSNARFETRPDDGKERWRSSEYSPHDAETKERYVYVHRLAAVAWMDSTTWSTDGLDALDGLVVHHDTPLGWLNTQGNLEAHTRDVHTDFHLNGEPLPEPVLALDDVENGHQERGKSAELSPDESKQSKLDAFA